MLDAHDNSATVVGMPQAAHAGRSMTARPARWLGFGALAVGATVGLLWAGTAQRESGRSAELPAMPAAGSPSVSAAPAALPAVRVPAAPDGATQPAQAPVATIDVAPLPLLAFAPPARVEGVALGPPVPPEMLAMLELPAAPALALPSAAEVRAGDAPIAAAPAPAQGASAPVPVRAGDKIDVNKATPAELELLPGIGPALAKRIIDYRTQHGAFQSVDELDKVKGIGPKVLERLRPLVVAGAMAPSAAPR